MPIACNKELDIKETWLSLLMELSFPLADVCTSAKLSLINMLSNVILNERLAKNGSKSTDSESKQPTQQSTTAVCHFGLFAARTPPWKAAQSRCPRIR
jgi:hypothetical protein